MSHVVDQLDRPPLRRVRTSRPSPAWPVSARAVPVSWVLPELWWELGYLAAQAIDIEVDQDCQLGADGWPVGGTSRFAVSFESRRGLLRVAAARPAPVGTAVEIVTTVLRLARHQGPGAYLRLQSDRDRDDWPALELLAGYAGVSGLTPADASRQAAQLWHRAAARAAHGPDPAQAAQQIEDAARRLGLTWPGAGCRR